MGSSTHNDEGLAQPNDVLIKPYQNGGVTNGYTPKHQTHIPLHKNANNNFHSGINMTTPSIEINGHMLKDISVDEENKPHKNENVSYGVISNGTIGIGVVFNEIVGNGVGSNGVVGNGVVGNGVVSNGVVGNGVVGNKAFCNGVPANYRKEHCNLEVEKLLSDTGFTTSEEFSEKSINCCQNKTLMIKTIIAGQILSFMLCCTGTTATALNNFFHVRTPAFNSFLMYTLLASTFGIYTITTKGFLKMMKKHWWKYLIVSILDVEGNYLITKAYTFTSLTSVQLCDSFTIPTVMVISFLFLRIRYKIIHYAGVLLCIAGAVSLVFLDGGDKEKNGSNEIVGDIIALVAAILYGTSNVGQEYLVKKYSSTKYLGMIGIYGFFISGIQTAALEYNTIGAIKWDWKIGLLFAAFAVAQYFYYSVMPLVMKLSSATVVNLSLLTSDLYTLMVGLFMFGYHFTYLYFVAFGSIIIGLVTYNIKPTPTAPKIEKKKQYKKKNHEHKNGISIAHLKSKLNKNTPLLTAENSSNYTRF